jgi:hypothetical protein
MIKIFMFLHKVCTNPDSCFIVIIEFREPTYVPTLYQPSLPRSYLRTGVSWQRCYRILSRYEWLRKKHLVRFKLLFHFSRWNTSSRVQHHIYKCFYRDFNQVVYIH